MKQRIGATIEVEEVTKKCVVKECGKVLNEVSYEWDWFIQDSRSEFDGEHHHVRMCRDCYAKIQSTFVGHVQSSNQVNTFLTYGGELDDLDENEKNRLSEDYIRQLREKKTS